MGMERRPDSTNVPIVFIRYTIIIAKSFSSIFSASDTTAITHLKLLEGSAAL